MELLIISGASGKLATVLSPVFVKVFPSIPKNHPSISYMTLNLLLTFRVRFGCNAIGFKSDGEFARTKSR
jgi:spore maturation protein SpmA